MVLFFFFLGVVLISCLGLLSLTDVWVSLLLVVDDILVLMEFVKLRECVMSLKWQNAKCGFGWERVKKVEGVGIYCYQKHVTMIPPHVP